MTRRLEVLIPLVAAVLTAALFPARACAVSSEIKDFRLFNCGSTAQSRCLTVTAHSADGSSFKQLFALSQLEIELKGPDHQILRTWQSESGYYDYENNRVVLFSKNDVTAPETVFDFSNVDTMKWK